MITCSIIALLISGETVRMIKFVADIHPMTKPCVKKKIKELIVHCDHVIGGRSIIILITYQTTCNDLCVLKSVI